MKQEPFEPGNYYHIFNRGNNKENIFKEEANYFYFLRLIKKYLTETCIIYAYCLVPNHFHILLKIKEEYDLPIDFNTGKKKIHQPFSNLFNAYSKAFNKRYERTGSLFQEHLHRIKVKTDDYLRELVLYIHLNPEKHGLTEDFCNYKYSSYQSFFKGSSAWTKRSVVISYFDNKENFMYCHQQKKLKLKLLKEFEELDEKT